MIRHLCVLGLLLVGVSCLKSGKVIWKPSGDMSNKQIDPQTVVDYDPDERRIYRSPKEGSLRLITAHIDDNTVKDKVQFFYYTRQNQQQPQELKPGQHNELLKRNINKPVKIVIHGYWHSSKNKMSVDLRKKIVEVQDVNVINVDWHAISRQFWYYNVADNTHIVGKYVASLLDWLVSQGVKPANIHLMGHSLGAHVCGYAGSLMTRGKVARITGLDPALPGFINVPPNKRLDPTDAQFVDCIHTCGGLLGIMDPICHADFYPNGGRNLQPGCLVIDVAGVCSHLRAPKYFTESVDPAFQFQAAQCAAIPTKGPVECTWTPHFMGYHLKSNARGLFYVQTANVPPFSKV